MHFSCKTLNFEIFLDDILYPLRKKIFYNLEVLTFAMKKTPYALSIYFLLQKNFFIYMKKRYFFVSKLVNLNHRLKSITFLIFLKFFSSQNQ